MLLVDEYRFEQKQWSFSAVDGMASDLYTRMELYVARNKTDGHVPLTQVPLLVNPLDGRDPDRTHLSLGQLMQVYPPCERALVERTTVGFFLPYYLKRDALGGVNETAAEAAERRRKETARKNRWRKKDGAEAADLSTRDKTGDRRVTSTRDSRVLSRAHTSPTQSQSSPSPEMHISVPPTPKSARTPRGGGSEMPQSGLGDRAQESLPLGDLLSATVARFPGSSERLSARKEVSQ